MRMTRRLVLAGSAALAAGAMLPLTVRRVWAVTTVTAGDFQVDSLSDGYLEFPADFAYARLITTEAEKVGQRLAREGVLGRFAVDFVTVQDDAGEWDAYAIELNLRKGGTTHPFLTLQFLTGGAYDGDAGVYRSASGTAKYLVATHHLEDAS